MPVPADDLPTNLVPASDLPDHLSASPAPITPDTSYHIIQNPDPTFPRDEAGYRYGGILPYRVKLDDKGEPVPGSTEWGPAPEFIRAPARMIQNAGERMSGPLTPEKMGPLAPEDTLSLLGVGGARAALGAITAPADAAAAALAATDRSAALDAAKQISASVRAAEIVARRANQDTAAGTTAQDVVDRLNRARELGKPATLVDVAGPNVKALAGSVARKPGEAQTVIKGALDQRDTTSGARLKTDVSRDLTGGPSAYRTVKTLIETRQAEAQPLYDKAFEGGSMAPLAEQFRASLAAAEAAEKNAMHDLDYASSVQQYGSQSSHRTVEAARQALARATATKNQVMEKFQQAQGDASSNAPGAVWNPRIQQFLDDPILKRGMARGIEQQRLDALESNRPFDPTELAVQPDGSVIKVPNMRTLDAGKKGLDAIIESEGRDEYGRLNQYGRTVNNVRLAYLKELDAVNPEYAAARASWSSHSASLDAVKFGRNLTRLNAEQVSEDFAALSPNDQEFARLGAADALLERIGKTGISGDEAKAVVKNEWSKGQLRPLFRTEADFDRFVESVGIERDMFETRFDVLRGSQTAARVAEDSGNDLTVGAHVAHGVASLLHGNLLSGAGSALRAYRDLGIRHDPDLNAAIARILTDLNVTPEVTGGRLNIRQPAPPLQGRPPAP